MARRRTPGLRKRGKYYHIQKRIRGYGELNETTGTSDLEEAERYFTHRIEEIRRIVLYGERPVVNFEQAAEKFLTENTHLRSLNRTQLAFANVMPYIGHLPLEQVHDDSLSEYKQVRLTAGIKPGTINRELCCIRRVLNLAARSWRHPNGMTYLPVPPLLTTLKTSPRKPYPLNWDEQERFFQELSPHLEQMALFDVNTGLRDQELCQFRWSWEVEFPELDTSVFVLPGEYSKNEEERVVVLNHVARDVLEAQRGVHPERVFTYRGQPVGRMLNTGWKKARNRAGLPHLRVHDLRHTFGHRLRAAGVPLEDRKALLGHTVGDITTHYSAPDFSRLLEYVERICDRDRGTVLRIVGQNSGKNSGKMRRLA